MAEELGQSCPTVALKKGTIFQSKIAEWSYYLGCVSAAVAIVYRALWFGGARLFGAPRVVPHNFLDLSILHKAREMPKEQFKREGTDPGETEACRLSISSCTRQISVIEQAIETAALMLRTDKSRKRRINLIA
ncbi:MAG: hypothetical protein WB616_17390 [Candidatus Sulfotelmatobacter sp.]